MKVSAIEIGTNSTKYAILDVNSSKEFKIIEKQSTVNRLSKSMYDDNYLSKEAMSQGANLISDYIKRIKHFDAKLISIFSTSVLRDAANGKEFIDIIKEAHGIDIDVISGDREAFLAYFANMSFINNDKSDTLAVDVGGGSTELILADKNAVKQQLSLNIGSVRLTERFIKTDFSAKDDYKNIFKYVNSILLECKLDCKSGFDLIGTGGSIKTIGRILMEVDYKDEQLINGLKIEKREIESILNRLGKLSLQERKNIQGLDPKRADVIVSGIIITLCVMDHWNVNKLIISTNGVLEGFILNYIHNEINEGD